MPITREEYFTAVHVRAEDLVSRCRGGAIRSADALREAVEEVVDGTCWIAYYPQAVAVLSFSDNPDYAEDAIGWGGLRDGSDSFEDLVARKAFYAMLADVEQSIAATADFDMENPSTWVMHERDPEDPWFTACNENVAEIMVADDFEAVTCPDCLRYRARREAAASGASDASA